VHVLPVNGSDMGVFARIMMGLAEQAPDNKTISIDATYLKAHRTASSLRLKKGGKDAWSGWPRAVWIQSYMLSQTPADDQFASSSQPDKSVIILVQPLWWMVCLKLTGSSLTEDMMLIGSVKPL
jgi:hypothetical protein